LYKNEYNIGSEIDKAVFKEIIAALTSVQLNNFIVNK